MNSIITLPTDLQSVIGTEKIDFAIIAKRNQPLNKSLGIIAFGTVWTAFTSIFVVALILPLFKGEDVHFEANRVPTIASWDNFLPIMIIGVFVLVGIGMLWWGFYSIFQKGGHFVGTQNRLIRYHKGYINSYDWEQFSGNVELNNKKGDISLQLRTGKMVNQKNAPDRFEPDFVYISGATDILNIEKICRKRIKENDPTPANNTDNQ